MISDSASFCFSQELGREGALYLIKLGVFSLTHDSTYDFILDNIKQGSIRHSYRHLNLRHCIVKDVRAQFLGFVSNEVQGGYAVAVQRTATKLPITPSPQHNVEISQIHSRTTVQKIFEASIVAFFGHAGRMSWISSVTVKLILHCLHECTKTQRDTAFLVASLTFPHGES